MPEKDGYTAFCYNLSPRELRYLVFGKKACPRCGGKLARRKGHTTLRDHMPHEKDEPRRINARKVKLYHFTYVCPRCGAEFPLSRLAKGEP